jgi:hypothetical protein
MIRSWWVWRRDMLHIRLVVPVPTNQSAPWASSHAFAGRHEGRPHGKSACHTPRCTSAALVCEVTKVMRTPGPSCASSSSSRRGCARYGASVRSWFSSAGRCSTPPWFVACCCAVCSTESCTACSCDAGIISGRTVHPMFRSSAKCCSESPVIAPERGSC